MQRIDWSAAATGTGHARYHNDKQQGYPILPPRRGPPISRKRTRPLQAGHVFVNLEPARAFCTTRHARTMENGGLSAGHMCMGRSLWWIVYLQLPAESSLLSSTKKQSPVCYRGVKLLLGACRKTVTSTSRTQPQTCRTDERINLSYLPRILCSRSSPNPSQACR